MSLDAVRTVAGPAAPNVARRALGSSVRRSKLQLAPASGGASSSTSMVMSSWLPRPLSRCDPAVGEFVPERFHAATVGIASAGGIVGREWAVAVEAVAKGDTGRGGASFKSSKSIGVWNVGEYVDAGI